MKKVLKLAAALLAALALGAGFLSCSDDDDGGSGGGSADASSLKGIWKMAGEENGVDVDRYLYAENGKIWEVEFSDGKYTCSKTDGEIVAAYTTSGSSITITFYDDEGKPSEDAEDIMKGSFSSTKITVKVTYEGETETMVLTKVDATLEGEGGSGSFTLPEGATNVDLGGLSWSGADNNDKVIVTANGDGTYTCEDNTDGGGNCFGAGWNYGDFENGYDMSGYSELVIVVKDCAFQEWQQAQLKDNGSGDDAKLLTATYDADAGTFTFDLKNISNGFNTKNVVQWWIQGGKGSKFTVVAMYLK